MVSRNRWMVQKFADSTSMGANPLPNAERAADTPETAYILTMLRIGIPLSSL